jgi:hypothetical protein
MDSMDRLTSKLVNGYVFGPYFKIHDDAKIKPIVDRLGAYEDTGLTPEEITNLHYDHQEFRRYVAENARLRAERDKAVEDINLVFGRVRALADCDGYHPYENVCDLCAFFDGGEKRECHGNCKNARWRGTEGKA